MTPATVAISRIAAAGSTASIRLRGAGMHCAPCAQRPVRQLRPLRMPLPAALLLVVLQGCAGFSADGGFAKVAEATQARTGKAPVWQRTPADTSAAQARVAELLQQPLSADTAVEVALLNSPGLQARFAELGIAEAELVRAGRLANPSFGFSRVSGGGLVEIDRSLVFNLLALLTLPQARQAEQGRFAQAQDQAALDAVAVAADARRAFFSAVAAQDTVNHALQVKDAADASTELARRMAQAGNFSALSQLRQQAFDADATQLLGRARQQAVAERERLVRVLGLSGAQLNFTLPPHLPDVPATLTDAAALAQAAMDQRLDVRMARRNTEATALSVGLSNATGLVNVLDAGYANKSQTGAARQSGYSVTLELPLFDFGTTRAQAKAVYVQALQHTAQVAVNAQSEVRQADAAWRSAHALALHYRDAVLPLKQRIAEENLLRYNGMLVSVFDLLADARDRSASVTAYVQAVRDFWLAQADLQTALTAGAPAATAMSSRR